MSFPGARFGAARQHAMYEPPGSPRPSIPRAPRPRGKAGTQPQLSALRKPQPSVSTPSAWLLAPSVPSWYAPAIMYSGASGAGGDGDGGGGGVDGEGGAGGGLGEGFVAETETVVQKKLVWRYASPVRSRSLHVYGIHTFLEMPSHPASFALAHNCMHSDSVLK